MRTKTFMCSTRRRITRRCVYTICMHYMFRAHIMLIPVHTHAHVYTHRTLRFLHNPYSDRVDILKYAFKIFTSDCRPLPARDLIQYSTTYHTVHTLSTRILMYVYSKTFPHAHTESEIP